MEKTRDQQSRTESKTRLVEQISTCLQAADYARALDLLRGIAPEFSNDTELSELEKLAQDGIKRKAEADRLITESQGLFAERKSAEAIRLLRQAYDLDKNNSLTRAILANALVEHAHSLVETDWWEAAKLAKQALELNPAHPTAKSIRNLLRDRKETSSVEEWASQASKLQSSGDLIAALSLIAEGLDVHSRDPKLLLLQDAIQRDQDARRRQSRRGDLEDLRRMESEVAGATDPAAKKALAARIQALAAKYWTDGAVLTVANHLLQRLGFGPQESSKPAPKGQRMPVIFHVPQPSAPESSRTTASSVLPSPVSPSPAASSPIASSSAPSGSAATAVMPPRKVQPSRVPVRIAPRGKVRITPTEPEFAPQVANLPTVEPPAPLAKVTSPSSRPKQPTQANSIALILVSVSVSVIILVAATIFYARKHPAPPVANSSAAAPTVSAPAVSAPAASEPAISEPAVSAPSQTIPEPSQPAFRPSTDVSGGTITPDDQRTSESGRKLGTLLVVAGQDDAKVFLNGKLERQLTRGGQLRLPNLELKDYVVRVSKSGFQDPPQQKIRIRKDEEAKLIFNLQPQPRLASLSIQGGPPGATVVVDQAPVGAVQPDGTFSISSVNPGDRTIELRKERFKPRQFKRHFTAGGAISLAAADATLEAASGELKITFAPADAKVAIVKGEMLTIVSSGVPLNLAAGTYTLTARTADRFTRSSTLEVVAGQSKALDLSLAPNGMSKWDDPGAWKHEKDSFVRKGGDFVLYGAVPASGTFIFSAMPAKGHVLQWVLNYTDPRNYVLFQLDDNNFHRTVIRKGQKTDEIIVPSKGDRKSFRALQIRVSPTEFVLQIRNGESWTVLDRWTQPGANLSLGKFGFYIPGNDEVAVSSFAHYADLNIR